jgi:hypothetical protein
MRLWNLDQLIIVRRRVLSPKCVTASIAGEAAWQLEQESRGRRALVHSRSPMRHLIACRSPSKSITSQPASQYRNQNRRARQDRAQYQSGRGLLRPPNHTARRRYRRMSGA